MQRLAVLQVLAHLEQVQELTEVSFVQDQTRDLLAREGRAVRHHLHELFQVPQLRGGKLFGTLPAGVLIVKAVAGRAAELVLVHSTSSKTSGKLTLLLVFLGVLHLYVFDLLPDVVAPDRLLEGQGDVRVDVGIAPGDDSVAALPLVDGLPRNAVHQQRLLVLFGHHHQTDGIGLLRRRRREEEGRQGVVRISQIQP
jgi:hypothetical protein